MHANKKGGQHFGPPGTRWPPKRLLSSTAKGGLSNPLMALSARDPRLHEVRPARGRPHHRRELEGTVPIVWACLIGIPEVDSEPDAVVGDIHPHECGLRPHHGLPPSVLL